MVDNPTKENKIKKNTLTHFSIFDMILNGIVYPI